MKRVSGLLSLAALLIAAAVVSYFAGRHLPVLVAAEHWIADYRIATLLPPEPQHPDILVVSITEDTLARFPYRSPVDRGFLADLLKALETRGARGILLDVLLDQPTEPEKDDRLRAVLRSITVPLAISSATQAEGLTPKQEAYLTDFVPEEERGLPNLAKDPYDSTVRWIFPGRTLDDSGDWMPGVVSLLADRLGHPMEHEPRPIVWRGSPADTTRAFASLPAHMVSLVPPAWIAGKIVLIGADLSLTDRHRTPFTVAPGEGTMSGVFIFAHALGTLLDDRKAPSWRPDWMTIPLLAGTVLLGGLLALLPLPLTIRIGTALGMIALYWIGAFALFRQVGVMLPLVVPAFAFSLATWAAEAAVIRSERKQRAFVRQAFSQFVSPDVVRQIVADPTKLALHGERREMTYLFSDIAGFTSLSEGLEAEALTTLLNDYLSAVCEGIHRHSGTVCNMMGDGVFALFGAPVAQDDHAERAVACALDLVIELEQFRKSMQRTYPAFGHTRIGVHSGPGVIGNVGSRFRFQYTALGDAVNTASRLEALNKHFGTHLCVSADALTDAYRDRARPLGRIVLKGRSQTTEVYEVLTKEATQDPRVAQYRKAYALLDAGKVVEARYAFSTIAAAWPQDGPTAVHLERLAEGERDTVIRMTKK